MTTTDPTYFRLPNNTILPQLWVDVVTDIEVDGVIRQYYWEVKNFTSSTWAANLAKSMSNRMVRNGDDVVPDQLLTDLAKLYKNVTEEGGDKLRQWVFTPDVLGLGQRPSPTVIADMESMMTEHVVELIGDAKN